MCSERMTLKTDDMFTVLAMVVFEVEVDDAEDE